MVIKIRALVLFAALPVVLASFTKVALADSFLVVPNANASTVGTSPGTFLLFGNGPGNPLTFQWDVAASQLTAMVGDTVTGIGFRLGSNSPSVTAPVTIGTWDLTLSSSLNPIGALSGTPANNIGSDAVSVLSGALTLRPLPTSGGVGPNPFFVIDFSTPFDYTGGDLLMTLDVADSSDFSVDANKLSTVPGLTDTVGPPGLPQINPTGAEFFSSPITEFQYTAPVPEPSSLLLLGTGLLGLWPLTRRRIRI